MDECHAGLFSQGHASSLVLIASQSKLSKGHRNEDHEHRGAALWTSELAWEWNSTVLFLSALALSIGNGNIQNCHLRQNDTLFISEIFARKAAIAGIYVGKQFRL